MRIPRDKAYKEKRLSTTFILGEYLHYGQKKNKTEC